MMRCCGLNLHTSDTVHTNRSFAGLVLPHIAALCPPFLEAQHIALQVLHPHIQQTPLLKLSHGALHLLQPQLYRCLGALYASLYGVETGFDVARPSWPQVRCLHVWGRGRRRLHA